MSPKVTWPPVNRFKNQFHLLKTVFESRLLGEPLTINIQAEKDEIESTLHLPGEKDELRFAHLLRDFAHPDSELFFPNLVRRFLDIGLVDAGDAKALAKHCSEVEGRTSGLIIDRTEMTGPAVFRLIADGGLLRDSPNEVTKVGALGKMPVALQMTQFHFHAFCRDVYEVLHHLYSLLRSVERQGVNLAPEPLVIDQPCCIYCLQSDGSFTSQEHVYPESLGNQILILEPGSVCDSCNHGILSDLDRQLVELEPVAFLRVFFVPYNPKTGKYPSVRTQRVTLRRVGPREIAIESHGMSKSERAQLSRGLLQWTGTRPFDVIALGRALYKIALGMVALQIGHAEALDGRYDAARDFILGRAEFPNHLLMSKRVLPQPEVSGGLLRQESGTLWTTSIYGLVFAINLEPLPRLDPALLLKQTGVSLLAFPLFTDED